MTTWRTTQIRITGDMVGDPIHGPTDKPVWTELDYKWDDAWLPRHRIATRDSVKLRLDHMCAAIANGGHGEVRFGKIVDGKVTVTRLAPGGNVVTRTVPLSKFPSCHRYLWEVPAEDALRHMRF